MNALLCAKLRTVQNIIFEKEYAIATVCASCKGEIGFLSLTGLEL